MLFCSVVVERAKLILGNTIRYVCEGVRQSQNVYSSIHFEDIGINKLWFHLYAAAVRDPPRTDPERPPGSGRADPRRKSRKRSEAVGSSNTFAGRGRWIRFRCQTSGVVPRRRDSSKAFGFCSVSSRTSPAARRRSLWAFPAPYVVKLYPRAGRRSVGLLCAL